MAGCRIASLVIFQGAVVDVSGSSSNGPLTPFAISTFTFPPFSNSFSFIHLIIYLDLYYTSMVTFALIVTHHPRGFASRFVSLCSVCALSVSALDCSFSFVFFNVQPSNLQTFKRFRPNSFTCHTSKISLVSPMTATDPKSHFRKPFICHTSKIPGGPPCGTANLGCALYQPQLNFT